MSFSTNESQEIAPIILEIVFGMLQLLVNPIAC